MAVGTITLRNGTTKSFDNYVAFFAARASRKAVKAEVVVDRVTPHSFKDGKFTPEKVEKVTVKTSR
jgi:hypothetical protein